MKSIHFLLTLVQLVIAIALHDKQRLAYLLYLMGIHSTHDDTGSRHHGSGPQSRARQIEIDADIVHHEYFTA